LHIFTSRQEYGQVPEQTIPSLQYLDHHRTMKRWISCLGLAALAHAAPSSWAHGGVRADVIIGPIGPWVYYPAPVYYPPTYVVPQVTVAPAPVYIQQAPVPDTSGAPPAAAPAASYYYCPESKAYYPYVQNCPSGWQRVAPQPPGAPQ